MNYELLFNIYFSLWYQGSTINFIIETLKTRQGRNWCWSNKMLLCIPETNHTFKEYNYMRYLSIWHPSAHGQWVVEKVVGTQTSVRQRDHFRSLPKHNLKKKTHCIVDKSLHKTAWQSGFHRIIAKSQKMFIIALFG